jgi:hypothetical protein
MNIGMVRRNLQPAGGRHFAYIAENERCYRQHLIGDVCLWDQSLNRNHLGTFDNTFDPRVRVLFPRPQAMP